jgi:cell wall-associated NlpC family hydrolase
MLGCRRLAVVVACSVGALLLAAPVAEAARFGQRTLRKGMQGSDVKTLQRYLTRLGHRTSVDGQFGRRTVRSQKAFERDESRRPDGVVTRSDARLLRRRVKEVTGSETPPATATPTDKASVTGDGLAVPPASAPPEVQSVIDAGNKIARKPYKYGGGHGRFRDAGYDCSGSVSYALHGAQLLDSPLASTGFESWGRRGRGTWITVRANSGHAYMIVAGLRFDTSGLRDPGHPLDAQDALGPRLRRAPCLRPVGATPSRAGASPRCGRTCGRRRRSTPPLAPSRAATRSAPP